MQRNDDTRMQNNSNGMQFYGMGVLLQWVRGESLVYWSIRGEEHCLNDIPTHCNAALILVRLLQLRNCVCCHQITATPTHTHTHSDTQDTAFTSTHPLHVTEKQQVNSFQLLYIHLGEEFCFCAARMLSASCLGTAVSLFQSLSSTPHCFWRQKKASVQLISLLIMKQGWNVNKKYSEKPNL